MHRGATYYVGVPVLDISRPSRFRPCFPLLPGQPRSGWAALSTRVAADPSGDLRESLLVVWVSGRRHGLLTLIDLISYRCLFDGAVATRFHCWSYQGDGRVHQQGVCLLLFD